jgi:hypothetical protein
VTEATHPGPSTRLLSMRRRRAFLFESLSDVANEIAFLDAQIETLRMQEIGGEGINGLL